MSEREFENYLKLIGKLLQLSRSQQQQITGELRDHLQSRVSELESQGVAHQDSVSQALEEFGDAAVMAKNFQAVMKLKRRRWLMRFATLSVAGVFLMLVFSMAMWPSNARFGSPIVAQANSGDNLEGNQEKVEIDASPELMSDATRRNLGTERRLREVVTLDYDETPWSDIERDLEERGEFNIILDQSARDDSLTDDEPITFQLSDIPLRKAMLMMLAEKNATFHIDHGIVVVISRDDAEDPQYMKVKMFNCRELIDKLESSQDDSLGILSGLIGQTKIGGVTGIGHAVEGSGSGAAGMGGGSRGSAGGGRGSNRGGGGSFGGGGRGSNRGGGGGFGGGGGPQKPKTKEDLLLDVVSSMVTPEEWESSGQGMANARIVNGVLIVKHRHAALADIESLLEDLAFQVGATSSDEFDESAASEGVRIRKKAPGKVEDGLRKEGQDPFGGNEIDEEDPFAAETNSDEDPFGAGRRNTAVRSPFQQN